MLSLVSLTRKINEISAPQLSRSCPENWTAQNLAAFIRPSGPAAGERELATDCRSLALD
jgi:hypothetical protein